MSDGKRRSVAYIATWKRIILYLSIYLSIYISIYIYIYIYIHTSQPRNSLKFLRREQKFYLVQFLVYLRESFNKSVSQQQFPDRLKIAQVSPIFKTDDPFIKKKKKNYRPVSVLSSHSKVFERVMFDQLSDHFENIFHTYLAAFRKGFGCQTRRLRLVENRKRELDNHRYVGSILMDLSNAFDCHPHGLIVDKLSAYGLSDSACSLLQNHLSDRKQMLKLGHCKSTLLNIIKGVPQGSILGPLFFNIFLNDTFHFVEKYVIYN